MNVPPHDHGVQSEGGRYLKGQSLVIPGAIALYAGVSVPIDYLACDGSAVSRTTYSVLFSVLCPSSGAATMTIASPCVVTLTAHGLIANDRFYFTTTGALPTGVAANTLYYVISAGLTANAFQFSATQGGAAINSSGTQSGTHTLTRCPWGLGDGSTTFNVPDLRHRVPVGAGTVFAAGQNDGVAEASRTPLHTHTGTTGIASDGNNQAPAGPDEERFTSINHTHAFTSASGGPSYAALKYIIKT